MRETSKCKEFRHKHGDYQQYLYGQGIDIGCGNDPLEVDHGEVFPWDLGNGDAQHMRGVPDCHYDFVYSSHCLEHLHSVKTALFNWYRILKPGGYLYVVVPDYLLYEKLSWPSRFNPDHKQSFSLSITRRTVGRTNHWHVDQDLIPLMQTIGFDLERHTLEDYGFDYNRGLQDQTLGSAVAQICIIGRRSTQPSLTS